MTEQNDVVVRALEFYDKNKEKYDKFLSKVKYLSFRSDGDKKYISFLDKNKEKIIESRYELLGDYYNDIKTWIWGWSQPGNKKSLIKTSKMLFDYGINIDYNKNKFLKTLLVTSRFLINTLVQLEINIAIASYLSKYPFVFNFYQYESTAEGQYWKNHYLDNDINYAISPLIILDYHKIDG